MLSRWDLVRGAGHFRRQTGRAVFGTLIECFLKWISPPGVGGEWARQELQLNLAVAHAGARKKEIVVATSS